MNLTGVNGSDKKSFFTKINKKYGIQFFLNKKLVFKIIEFENLSNIYEIFRSCLI